MAKVKWQDCRRCDGPFLETSEEAERRNFLNAAKLCQVCLEEFEEVKKSRGLGPLYYIGNTEPLMF
jgi:hypothetical protein